MRSAGAPPAHQRPVHRPGAETRLRRPPLPPERWRGAFSTWSAYAIAGGTRRPARDSLYYAPSSVYKVLTREILRSYKTLRTRLPAPRAAPPAPGYHDGGHTGLRRTLVGQPSSFLRGREGMRMRPTVNRFAGLASALVLSMSRLGAAADPDLRLINAVAEQDRTAIRTLLKQGVDVNATAPVVEKLLAARANPNATQTSGLTPLMIATHTGSVAIVKALIAHGANVNASTVETHDTALMWAVGDQHKDIARVLIDNR